MNDSPLDDLADRIKKYIDAHIGKDTKVTCQYHIIRNALEFRVRTTVDKIKEAGPERLQFDYYYPFWEVVSHASVGYNSWGYDPEKWDTDAIVAEVCLMASRAFNWHYVFYFPEQRDVWHIGIDGSGLD